MPPWTIDALAPVALPGDGDPSGVWGLARALQQRGHRVRVLYPTSSLETPPPPGPIASVPVPLVGVGRRPLAEAVAAGRNASALLNRSADIVLAHDVSAGSLESRLVPAAGRPVLGLYLQRVELALWDARQRGPPNGRRRSALGGFFERRGISGLESRAIRRARLLLVTSEADRQLLGSTYDVPPDRVRLLPRGIPDPLDVGTTAEARLALHVPADVPVVAFVGGPADGAALPLALDSFRRIRVFFPGARLLVAGLPTPAEPGVVPLGGDDPAVRARALRATDVFLYPARRAGFSAVPYEAMRYGAATIVSGQVVLDGIPAPSAVRIVPTEDPGDYASELAELLADPALRRAIGEAGRQLADELNFDRMATRFEEAFRPVVGA